MLVSIFSTICKLFGWKWSHDLKKPIRMVKFKHTVNFHRIGTQLLPSQESTEAQFTQLETGQPLGSWIFEESSLNSSFVSAMHLDTWSLKPESPGWVKSLVWVRLVFVEWLLEHRLTPKYFHFYILHLAPSTTKRIPRLVIKLSMGYLNRR